MGREGLRIGLDARAAVEVQAGRGRYVRELARALLALGADVRMYGRVAWPLPGSRWRLIQTGEPAWGVHAAYLAGRECDVLLASNSYLMTLAAVPTVAVVFDLFGFDRRYALPASALAERLTLPIAVHRAAGFVCISEATRAELEARFPRTRGRTVAIPLGADRALFAARPDGVAGGYGLKPPFVLSVGTLEPRKNLVRLIEAFASIDPMYRAGWRLALVGASGWSSRDLDDLAARHRDVVSLLGFVPDEDLPALYAEATVFAYPSLAEGFGLPVVEAMAAGAPVLTSDRPSLSELAGDAALLVDPTDTGAVAAGLERLMHDEALRAALSDRGQERAAAFTWARTARETLDYLTSVTSTLAAGKRRARKVSS